MSIPYSYNRLGIALGGGGTDAYIQDGLVQCLDSFLWGGVPWTWRDNSPAKCDAAFSGSVYSYNFPGEPRECLDFNGGATTKAPSLPITTEQFTIERTLCVRGGGGLSAGLVSTVDGVDTTVVRDEIGATWRWHLAGYDGVIIGGVPAVRPEFDLSCYAITVSPLNNGTVSTYLNGNVNSVDVGIKLPPYENIKFSNNCGGVVILNVRVYNRALTQDELARNWHVDRTRYRCAIIHP